MKGYFLLLASLCAVMAAPAQKRFKDVYEEAQTMKDYEAYQAYCNFQRNNNTHAATCYQIGVIAQSWIANYDPFLQSSAVKKNVYDAELFLTLAKRFLDERNARSDARFYKGVQTQKAGKNPTFAEIFTDIDNRLKEVTEYRKTFDENTHSIVNAVSKYNNCIEIFNDINKKNSRLKDLYFLVDDSLKQQLTSLEMNFDSALFYLNNLQKSLKKKPMGNYQFNYTLNPIVVYRLHGLTLANFLAPNIQLWDFGDWIKGFNKVVNSEIDFLYRSAEEQNKRIKDFTQNFTERNLRSIPTDYKVPPLILNKIYKYDFASSLGAMFTYQNGLLDFMHHVASFKTDTSLLAFRTTTPSNYYFYRMLEKKNFADSLLGDFSKSITEEGVKKYNAFFNKNYGGYNGLKKYASEQGRSNGAIMKNALGEYSKLLINAYVHDSLGCRTLMYNKEPIFMELTAPDLIWSKGYFVHATAPRTDKKMLLAGTYVNRGGQKFGFVALVDTLKEVQWLKTFRQGEGSRSCVLVGQVNDEIATVMTTANIKTGAVKNHMIILDWNGNTKQTKELQIPAVPRRMIIDDISYSYIIAFKGNVNAEFVQSEDSLYVCRLDAQLNTSWRKSLWVNGYVASLVRAEKFYYVYGAYSRLVDFQKSEFSIGDRVNAFACSIEDNGTWGTCSRFDSPYTYFPIRVSKIDSRMVEVISVMDTYPYSIIKDMRTKIGDPHYMAISFGGNVLKLFNP